MSKAKKQRASAQETLLAKRGLEKNARFESAFRPLEKAAINELNTANVDARAGFLKGRAAADTNQHAAELDTSILANGAGGANRGFNQATAVGRAASAGLSDADRIASDSIDADTLNVIRTGQSVNRSASSALISSARLANSRSASILEAQRVKDRARGRALGTVTTAAVGGFLDAKEQATSGVPKGGVGPYEIHAIPTEDLGFVARRLRKKHTGG